MTPQTIYMNQGVINTQNLLPAGAGTPGSFVEINLNGCANLAIQTVGTYTGALSVQATLDGVTWVTYTGSQPLISIAGAYSASIPSASQSIYQVQVAGFVKARVAALAAVTGSVTVTLT